MKNIKTTLKALLILVLGLSLNASYAQTEDIKVEVKNKEKKITIRKVKEVNGEKIEWDTTIVMTDENKEEEEKYLQEHANVHSEMNFKFEMLDEDMKGKLIELKEHQIIIHELAEHLEGDEGLKKHINIIVKMAGDMKDNALWIDKEHAFTFALGDSLMELHAHGDSLMEYVFELSDGHKKIIEVAKGEYLHIIKEHKYLLKEHKHRLKAHKHHLKELHKDGKAFAYFVKDGDSTVKIDIDFDHDFEFDGEHKFVVDVNIDEDGKNHMIWIDENRKHKNLSRRMKFVGNGDKHENVIFFGDDAHSIFSFDMKVDSELEEADFALLKKAGVKVKSKELAVDRLRLTFEDDGFGLVFKLKSKGKATIKLVNSNGELIFNDKVQYFPGTYHKSLNLNSENAGSYLIYIEQGGASFSSKIKLK